MTHKKKVLVAAAIAGLMVSSTAMAGAAFPGHDSMKKGGCDMNGCKGKSSCKGSGSCKSGHACSGSAGCKGAHSCKGESAKIDGGTLSGQ